MNRDTEKKEQLRTTIIMAEKKKRKRDSLTNFVSSRDS